jgi:hypothetical protein
MHKNSSKLEIGRFLHGAGGYSMVTYPGVTFKEIMTGCEAHDMESRLVALTPGSCIQKATGDDKIRHHAHFRNFFKANYSNKTITDDATYCLYAIGAILLSNASYFNRRMVSWDPATMSLL